MNSLILENRTEFFLCSTVSIHFVAHVHQQLTVVAYSFTTTLTTYSNSTYYNEINIRISSKTNQRESDGKREITYNFRKWQNEHNSTNVTMMNRSRRLLGRQKGIYTCIISYISHISSYDHMTYHSY